MRVSDAGIDYQSMRKISRGNYRYGAIVARMNKGEHQTCEVPLQESFILVSVAILDAGLSPLSLESFTKVIIVRVNLE